MDACTDNINDLIFFHFDENEDSFFVRANDLIKSDDPQEIWCHVSHLKVVGNDMFKGHNYVGASENYELAIKLCSLLLSKDVEMNPSFCDMVLSLNLNLAACSLKKCDFLRAGQICSLVLQLDSHNVKALFRRATAALKLNKPDLAYIDLIKAFEIEPSDMEVENKLNQTKNLLGLPFSGKRKCEQLDSEGYECRGTKVPFIREGVCEVVRKLPKKFEVSESSSSSGQEHISSPHQVVCSKVNDDPGVVVCSPSTSCLSEASTTDKASVVDSDCGAKNSNLAEPKVRFSNRRRQGSSLQLSRSTYDMLLKGGEVCCVNVKQLSIIKVRVLGVQNTTFVEAQNSSSSLEAEEGSLSSESIVSTIGSQVEVAYTADNSDAMEEVIESTIEPVFSPTQFSFSSHNKSRRHVRANPKYRLIQRHRGAVNKRGKIWFPSNIYRLRRLYYMCRYYVGGKRKFGSYFSDATNMNFKSVKRKRLDTSIPKLSREMLIVGNGGQASSDQTLMDTSSKVSRA